MYFKNYIFPFLYNKYLIIKLYLEYEMSTYHIFFNNPAFSISRAKLV